MNPTLLLALDEYRSLLGHRVVISPAPGALGRHLGDSNSQHNVDKWGTVNAADIMPDCDLEFAYIIAQQTKKFSGIGIYPDWKPKPGLHLDVRPTRTVNNPATWGAVRDDEGKQVYVGADGALNKYVRSLK